MKVKELIEKLQELPQNLDVVFEHPEFGEYGVISGACVVDTSGNCDGSDCEICIKCSYFSEEKDLAVEIYW